MNSLNFSDNIIRLRHSRKITQEQLADFIGVTKASVSKWETKQSLPDVLLLPKLAAFFDVTIDELLGYESQLSKEQIRKIYRDLSEAFAEVPFEKAMEQSRSLVKRYYACYPFLFQICVLWFNHFMLADSPERQRKILTDVLELCDHIISGCKDIGICNDAVILKSTVELQMGKPGEVIEILEEILNPCRLAAQSDSVLIQAYQMCGKTEEADSYTQISMYLHLFNLIGSAVQYLTIHSDKPGVCEETIRRIEKLAEVYCIEQLHPNVIAGFWYQAAIVCCMHEKKQEALLLLTRYSAACEKLFSENGSTLHGDSYFDRIDEWIERLDLGADAPRDKRVVLEGLVQSLQNPAFSLLEDEEDYRRIRHFWQTKETEDQTKWKV